ncbi:hypothetical protein [Vibrio tapetis]|uniref:Cellobiose phosphorylase n=1 Tax=Vibrio tapetis subsp. tapetis TaxID=1671868 RepID=A0A2N8ZL09_9VIBR|nr:hypothetical protein [Vibrio tapetis]SON52599.1 conserved protein of unknown function [Vibrio tapetis subsp. tapetis]
MHHTHKVTGGFTEMGDDRYYKIENVDSMAPFFISVVSSSDHWLFISSTGCLSAGRIRPENALFPYRSVDHIHESAENTGSKTVFRVPTKAGVVNWEPFNPQHDGIYNLQRNLYKNVVGDKVLFEEINHTLQLRFCYSWSTSEQFGFIRRSELTDLSSVSRSIEMLDGIQNILPPGAPLPALQTRSALVDAYKWNERVEHSSLALYSMYAMLSDKAAPAESLLATSVFSLGCDSANILLSSGQLQAFRQGKPVQAEPLTKGLRGSYLINKTVDLKADQSASWYIVADIDKSHSDIARFMLQPCNEIDIERSITANKQELISLMSGADAWQLTNKEETCVHHYANVLFNNMRGGVFVDGYQLDIQDVRKTITHSNSVVAKRHQTFFDQLENKLSHQELIALAKLQDDPQLLRLCYEYLPLTFGRRHGDPSRPWNHYEIKVKDENGDRLLSYQGNWRDIFQNWEASALSYPEFISSFIAKFTNASTIDGYNPYRITKDGIDWEILDPEDPWSNIGYWGDHQIIYLLKFLELANNYQQTELIKLLNQDCFSYANVPYELCDEKGLFANPKDTVSFNGNTQKRVEQKVDEIGSDGRLILDSDGEVYLVNLTEKLLVPLLSKLSNLVLDGGIWLNTQRPEWNDANNAIVGNGLSMVTLYYMRRYVAFMQELLCKAPSTVSLSTDVLDWLTSTMKILESAAKEIRQNTVTRQTRRAILTRLEKAASDYRQRVYRTGGFSGKTQVELGAITELMDVSLTVLDDTIANNKREDGLFNAYNIINYSAENLEVSELYPMLEGQVAILSAGVLQPKQAVTLLERLFASEMYRDDQQSFMLYPDRNLAPFINKNSIPSERLVDNELIQLMLAKGDTRVVNMDVNGSYHFNPSFENSEALDSVLAKLEYSCATDEAKQQIRDTYEMVFTHKEFTGRSGTMFGYEGLGSIYWHMVSKLLLAVQENYHTAYTLDSNSEETRKLAEFYYRVREGIGFNKTPQNYGAFPTDPYSHTPKQSGAQQPGMTGQVKEEILTRFRELGLYVHDGVIAINPSLLKQDEFLDSSQSFKFENVAGESQSLWVSEDGIAFTYCQVPFIYQLTDDNAMLIAVEYVNGDTEVRCGAELSGAESQAIFARSGIIKRVRVHVPVNHLL